MRSRTHFMLAILVLGTYPAFPAHAASVLPGSSGYLSDARGQVVMSGFGNCWRVGTWTPEQATVVGCDGVLAKAMPVPAAAPSSPPPKPDTSPVPAEPAAVAPISPAPVPKSEKVTLDTDAYFDFDKASLKPEGKQQLQALASRLKDMTLEVVVTTGHTDAVGSDTYNQKLSLRRAQAVKANLQEQGLPADKIFTEGKGETQPIASNKTKAGRAKNRRVVVEVVGVKK